MCPVNDQTETANIKKNMKKKCEKSKNKAAKKKKYNNYSFLSIIPHHYVAGYILGTGLQLFLKVNVTLTFRKIMLRHDN